MGNAELPDFDALWDYERPDVSERAFRNLLPLVGIAAYRTELLTQIARAEGLQRRFDEAHRTLDQVEALLKQSVPRVLLRYLLERGRVLSSSGNRQQARPLFLAAWELGQIEGEDALAIDAAHMLGIVEPSERQLDWSLRALDLAERSDDPRAQKWAGSLLNNIGWTYHKQGRWDEALEHFRRALAWREAEGVAKEFTVARWCVARSLRSLGQFEEALAMQRDLLANLEARGERDGYVHEELGECLFALDRAEEARAHFALAHTALAADPGLATNEPARLQRLQQLGRGNP